MAAVVLEDGTFLYYLPLVRKMFVDEDPCHNPTVPMDDSYRDPTSISIIK